MLIPNIYKVFYSDIGILLHEAKHNVVMIVTTAEFPYYLMPH